MDPTKMMGINSDQTLINPGAMGATLMDSGRTQLGGTTTCPACQASTSLLEKYCGECGFMLGSNVIGTGEVPVEVFAYLIDRTTKQKYPLHEGVNTVGRVNADIQIAEATLSRSHAKIVLTSGTIIVEDLGSSNGTKIGNERLLPGITVPVGHGTKIRFGMWRTIIQVASQGDALDEPDVVDAPPTLMPSNTPPAYEDVVNQNVALSYIFGSPSATPAPAPEPPPIYEPEPEPEPAIGLANMEQPPMNLFGDAPTPGMAPPPPPLYDYDSPAPPSADSAWVIYGTLVCTEGLAPNIQVMDGAISIGRKVGNDVVLPQDSFVSGRHAILRHDNEGTHLIDVGSTNGTVVNGMKLEPNHPQLLFEGDEIQIGKSQFTFYLKTGA